MRLPLMTTRRWMIAVAVVAVVLWISDRRSRFRRAALEHEERGSLVTGIDSQSPRAFDADRWHMRMAEKYHRAACYPWLPVWPDPPPPE